MRWGALLVGALLVGGCEQADKRICTSAPKFPYDEAEAPQSCAHRWAYRLARSKDPAPIVAEAVMQACKEPLDFYKSARLGATAAASERPLPVEQFFTDVTEDTRREALFRVVQARAGHCDI